MANVKGWLNGWIAESGPITIGNFCNFINSCTNQQGVFLHIFDDLFLKYKRNFFSVYSEGGCTWPSPFVSSTWRDNTRGEIAFGTDTLQGWHMEIHGSSINNWECLDNTYFDSEQLLIIKLVFVVFLFKATIPDFVPVILTCVCIIVTVYVYSYKLQHMQWI